MKRWFILLLIFVLPLQMSWANGHLWNNTATDISALSAGEPRHTHVDDMGDMAHTDSAHPGDGHGAADPLTAEEHASAHAHDGLHHVLLPLRTTLCAHPASTAHCAHVLQLRLDHQTPSLDRPQWHPA
jgi:hypothetical protein